MKSNEATQETKEQTALLNLNLPILKAEDPSTPIFVFTNTEQLSEIYLKQFLEDKELHFIYIIDKEDSNFLCNVVANKPQDIKEKYVFILLNENNREQLKLLADIKNNFEESHIKFLEDNYLIDTNFNTLMEASNEHKEEAKVHYLDILENYEDLIKSNYLNNYCIENYLIDFKKNLPNSESLKMYSTGYNNLDFILGGGLMKGLITIGAGTGLGKTTFILQVAEQIAQRRNAHILYFSLEMSRKELIAKSISRITRIRAEQDNKPNFNTDTIGVIQAKKYNQFNEEKKTYINESIDYYYSYAKNMFIFESNPRKRFTVEDIERIVINHKQKTGQNDIIVVIDYLQIMKSEDPRLSDKQFIDNTITTLKGIATEQNITVIAISSLNRASYDKEIDLSSFKESGSIEYTSDIVLALDYTIYKDLSPKGHRYNEICSTKQNGQLGEMIISKKNKLIADTIEEDKSKGFYKVSLTILKHRYGDKNLYTNFKFFFHNNIFTELTDNKANFEDLAKMLKTSSKIQAEELSQDLPF